MSSEPVAPTVDEMGLGKGSFDHGDPTTTNLYVGNLAPTVTEETLEVREAIADSYRMTDRPTKEPLHFLCAFRRSFASTATCSRSRSCGHARKKSARGVATAAS